MILFDNEVSIKSSDSGNVLLFYEMVPVMRTVTDLTLSHNYFTLPLNYYTLLLNYYLLHIVTYFTLSLTSQCYLLQ